MILVQMVLLQCFCSAKMFGLGREGMWLGASRASHRGFLEEECSHLDL